MALKFGVKYIYRTMPRLLTLWLDLGENFALQNSYVSSFGCMFWLTIRHPDTLVSLQKITKEIDSGRRNLPVYQVRPTLWGMVADEQWLTAFPQLVSRILHPEPTVNVILYKIIAQVILKYPNQALWPMVGVMRSNRSERSRICRIVLDRAVRLTLHGNTIRISLMN